ncbi:MAG: alanyl-tRNA editing protein, partial [Pseudomonadota bacterium]
MTPTRLLFAEDAYRKAAPAVVMEVTEEGGLILDACLFYARGGGQPGDSGRITWRGGRLDVATAVRGTDGSIVAVPAAAGGLPSPGTTVDQHLDWDRRYGHMRVHTALHLLSVVLAYPVTGGAIAADRGRLDFAMPDAPPAKDDIAAELNALIARDLPITEEWIEEAEFDANPGLVKTMSVAPPRGRGPIRLIAIGDGADRVDLQPCGGTHVARTGEIGPVTVTKTENKGRQNRR